MAIKINDEAMTAELDGSVIATAVRTVDRWAASNWPNPLTRNQAITALMLAERLAEGHSEDDPFIAAWREELSRG